MITLFDTSIASKNVGDFIIMDAVNEQLANIIPFEQIVTLPTHDTFGREGRRVLNLSEYSIVGGTNLLSSHLLRYQQWKFGAKDLLTLNHAVLMGVGWWQYQNSPDLYSRTVWNRVLNKKMLHSVRDSFTEKQLSKMGIKNVINTSCSTMWGLTPEHCKKINQSKSNNVVVTLTDYNRDPNADLKLINCLLDNYSEVSFWPQGSGDVSYFESLHSLFKRNVTLLNPSLTCLNNALSNADVDYVGTRLHAGIRALQYKKRTIIIGIDNRAIEKSIDFNLTVLKRTDIEKLNALINKEIETKIRIPFENIQTWKSQFV
ncbi:polysaccharide pyruvyl transferase family protein [Agarivorans sp. Alg241-V36]|uniref:polysaccharide pyruvyl transferase family protein n=1 Tax=Agarivorans sp. Alg241-V36 TaxID=2305992 RepID=UPI0013D3D16E|nr:polysaccharide pyruvyl transferase family protein [Agarivorans sp. Alg241-V36]